MSMKRLAVLLLVAVGGALGVGWTAGRTDVPEDELPPLPTYTIHRVPSPVRVDGRLDEPAWQAATPVDLIYWWPNQTGPNDQTTVRLLWDDEALYVGYDCVDRDITATHQVRDDPTYKDDCCEIFVMANPERKPQSYIGLEMNAGAVMYDYGLTMDTEGRITLFRDFDLKGYQLATWLDGTLNIRGDDDYRWQLEVLVPFTNFQDLTNKLPPEPGAEWHAQINRWNGVEPDRALCLWSHSGKQRPDPHNPDRFGTLVFGAE